MRMVSKLKIGHRLGLGFGSILAVMLLSLSINAAQTGASRERLIERLSAAEKKVELASAMKESLLKSAVATRNVGLRSEVAAMQSEEARFREIQKKYAAQRQELASLGLSDGETQAFERLSGLDAKIDAAFKDALNQALAFNSEGATKIISEQIDPLNTQQMQAIDALIESEKKTSENASALAVGDAQRQMRVMLGVALVSVIAGALWAWRLTVGITAPLQNAARLARGVAEGDLRGDEPSASGDETGRLLQSLGAMRSNLRGSVGQVRSQSEGVAALAESLSASSERVAQDSSAQKASASASASAISEMSLAIENARKNAQSARELTRSGASLAGAADQKLDQMKSELDALTASVEQISSSVEQFIQSALSISGMTEQVKGIAQQTNLLALNAAIEAARAGESGRGFAVVADEVRKLAEKSALSAQEIATVALSLGSQSKAVEGSLGSGRERLRQSQALLGEVSCALKESAQTAGLASDGADLIAKAIEEQSALSSKVAQNIESIARLASDNFERVGDSSKAAARMKEASEELKLAVNQFKL